MISVDLVYKRVNEDLSRKNKSGYTSNDEFNRDLDEAQIILMNYYHHLFQETKHLADAVAPFVKSDTITLQGQVVQLPADYRHMIEIAIDYLKNPEECGVEPKQKRLVVEFARANEVERYRSSYIMRPNLDKGVAFWTFLDGAIKVWPKVSVVDVMYLRNPSDATRGVTINTVDDLEVYNAATTTDLEWPASELSNFVDICLLFKGVAVKESALIQYAATKTQAIKQSMI